MARRGGCGAADGISGGAGGVNGRRAGRRRAGRMPAVPGSPRLRRDLRGEAQPRRRRGLGARASRPHVSTLRAPGRGRERPCFHGNIAACGNVRAGTPAHPGPAFGGASISAQTLGGSAPRGALTCGQDARGPRPRLRRGKHFSTDTRRECAARVGNVRAGCPRSRAPPSAGQAFRRRHSEEVRRVGRRRAGAQEVRGELREAPAAA